MFTWNDEADFLGTNKGVRINHENVDIDIKLHINLVISNSSGLEILFELSVVRIIGRDT